MDKIYDLLDKLAEDKFSTVAEYYRTFPQRARIEKYLHAWDGKVCAGPPVFAYVERGRWIASCECGSAGWVTKGELFWCFECGNSTTNGCARPVEFPKDKKKIEAELLTRELVELGGKTDTQRVLNATPKLHRLGREWRWGEKVSDLKKQKEKATREA